MAALNHSPCFEGAAVILNTINPFISEPMFSSCHVRSRSSRSNSISGVKKNRENENNRNRECVEGLVFRGQCAWSLPKGTVAISRDKSFKRLLPEILGLTAARQPMLFYNAWLAEPCPCRDHITWRPT
jgi:hypothetical protein